MKERLLFICVGQAGGNIGREFENSGYNCIFINTSADDLSTIEAKNKYHIPAGTGCNKDRQKALGYAKDYYKTMMEVIDSKFPLQDIVFFIFSLGGGTGSGIAPVLLDIISQQNPQKTYGAITIIPGLNESLQAQSNSVEAYKQLTNVQRLKNLFVLDNGAKIERLDMNKRFFAAFDKLINITNPDERGIIDSAELETLLKCKGSSQLLFSEHQISNNCFEDKCLTKGIFAENEFGCKYIAGLNLDNTGVEIVKKRFGTPIDIFQGYDDKDNFIVIAGSKYPDKTIKALANNINEKSKEISWDYSYDVDIPAISLNQGKKEPLAINKEINFEEIFQKYN